MGFGEHFLTPRAKRFLKYLISFGVTFAAGTAPLWGSGRISGFHAILDVYPRDLQDVIPWTSFLMSIVAVGVQAFGDEAWDRERVKYSIGATLALLVIVLFVSYGAYKAFVIRIQIPAAGEEKVSYLIGSTLLPKCECAKRGLDIRECIGFAISANPDDVSACYPLQEIQRRSTFLSMLYMLVMLLLGTAIGLLVVKESVEPKPPKPKRRKRGAAPAEEPPTG